MSEVSFDLTSEELKLVGRISNRYINELGGGDRMSMQMDIAACHCNGSPLDLRRFLNSDYVDFAHDILGITASMNRETGVLTNNFVPRCALPQEGGKDE